MSYRSAKAKIKTDTMPENDVRRLGQIFHRDTRLVARYLGAIAENEAKLRINAKTGKRMNRIDKIQLDLITATTDDRKEVDYDLKAEFPRISLNELKECRDTAVAMYDSYLALRESRRASKPTVNGHIPRSIGYNRFKLNDKKHIVSIMDSMDTNPRMIREGKKRANHNWLDLPIVPHKHLFDTLEKGELKAIKILKEKGEYYLNFSVKIDIPSKNKIHYIGMRDTCDAEGLTGDYWLDVAEDGTLRSMQVLSGNQSIENILTKPVAVLGGDFGINISLFATLHTEEGIMEFKTFRVPTELEDANDEVEKTIRKLQRNTQIRNVEKLRKDLEGKYIKLLSSRIVSGHNSNGIKHLMELLDDISDKNIDRIVELSTHLWTELKSHVGKIDKILDSVKNKKSASAKQTRHQCYKLRKPLRNMVHSLYLCKQLKEDWGRDSDGLFKKLRELKHKRKNIKIEIDRIVTRQFDLYVARLAERYDLYVSVGKLKGIRNIARRGNKNKRHRIRIHRWSFARLTTMIEQKMVHRGMGNRFHAVPEQYTSKKCWKCGNMGKRPVQHHYICTNPACRWQGHADINGSINIAKTGVKFFKLIKQSMYGKKGLGMYLLPEKSKTSKKNREVPNAQGKSQASNRKRPKRSQVSKSQVVEEPHSPGHSLPLDLKDDENDDRDIMPRNDRLKNTETPSLSISSRDRLQNLDEVPALNTGVGAAGHTDRPQSQQFIQPHQDHGSAGEERSTDKLAKNV